MKINESEYNKLLDELRGSTKEAVKKNIDNNNHPIQLYLSLKTDSVDKDRAEKASFVTTEDYIEESEKTFLIASVSNDKHAVQASLNLFNEEDYKEKVTEMLIEMKSSKMYDDAIKELTALQEFNAFSVVNTNDEIKKSLEEIGARKAFDIFINQYIDTKPQHKLSYSKHAIVSEIENEQDAEILLEKYNLTKEELQFLKITNKLGLERAEELSAEYLETRIDEVEIKNPKSLEEISNEKVFDDAEKNVLYLSNITSTIYDMYKDNSEFSMDWFKEAAINVIDTFSKNKVSLSYVMEKIEADSGITKETMNLIKKGYPKPNIDHEKQQYMDFTKDKGSNSRPPGR